MNTKYPSPKTMFWLSGIMGVFSVISIVVPPLDLTEALRAAAMAAFMFYIGKLLQDLEKLRNPEIAVDRDYIAHVIESVDLADPRGIDVAIDAILGDIEVNGKEIL